MGGGLGTTPGSPAPSVRPSMDGRASSGAAQPRRGMLTEAELAVAWGGGEESGLAEPKSSPLITGHRPSRLSTTTSLARLRAAQEGDRGRGVSFSGGASPCTMGRAMSLSGQAAAAAAAAGVMGGGRVTALLAQAGSRPNSFSGYEALSVQPSIIESATTMDSAEYGVSTVVAISVWILKFRMGLIIDDRLAGQFKLRMDLSWDLEPPLARPTQVSDGAHWASPLFC
jgi:hypothetical protein